MRAYAVKPVKSSNPDGTIKTRFAGSQSEAAAEKKTMQEKHELKRTEVGFDEIEIPTNKAELIPWLNKTFG